MKLVSLKCPECSAKLDVTEDVNHFYCSYCGAEIMLDNKEEIETKRAELEKTIKETEKEVELKKIEREEDREDTRVGFLMMIVAMGFMMCFAGFVFLNQGKGHDILWSILIVLGVIVILASAIMWFLSEKKRKDD